MKKKGILITSLALALLLVVGGVMAWFTADAEVINKFKAGTLNVDLIDDFDHENPANQNVNPGDKFDKIVTVENKGTKRAYVRIKLTPTWEGMELEDPFGPANLVGYDENIWIYHVDKDGNGYYYYHKMLQVGEKAPALFTKIEFDGEEMGIEFMGKKFDLKVEMEAIQVTNGAMLDAWKVDPADIPITAVPVLDPTP